MSDPKRKPGFVEVSPGCFVNPASADQIVLPPAPLLPSVSASECRELAERLVNNWGSASCTRAAAILRSVADAIDKGRKP